MLMTCHFSDMGSAIDWFCCEGILLEPIRSTICHQYGISSIISQMSFCREFGCGIANIGCFLRLQNTSFKLKLVFSSLRKHNYCEMHYCDLHTTSLSWHVWNWYFWQIRMHFQGIKLQLIVTPMHQNFSCFQVDFLKCKGLYFMEVTCNNT